MPRRQYVLVMRNEAGELVDLDGNKRNEDGERIDDWGNVIPEPEEKPITSSLGNGSTSIWQPQTLADYNRPDLFYHKRAEIQVDMDCLDEEPPRQDFQFQEIPDSEILARIQRTRETCAEYFKKLDAIFNTVVGITEETNQKEETHSEYEAKAEFDGSGSVSVDRDECVDRHMCISSQTSSEIVSVDTDLCVDRHEVLPDQASSVSTSVDTVLCVDRREPRPPESDVLESFDASEPPQELPVHAPESPVPDLDTEPSAPDPKPPDHHETELVEVLPEEAATPGSCHKRKLPDTTLQPPLKLFRAYPGAAILLPAAYLIDPTETYAVYSRGPRPPPLLLRYVSSKPSSSPAGTHSHPPRRAHPMPDVAYLIDPEKTYVVYHLGPRPP